MNGSRPGISAFDFDILCRALTASIEDTPETEWEKQASELLRAFTGKNVDNKQLTEALLACSRAQLNLKKCKLPECS
ncbi:hypothetical protein [Mesorhizobium sp. B1-1-8]|uniref:hypothetical protein n=1 Tax=Mesorhizobium sp. B1-1-8 TaxID=2589976 RepID=UPI001126BD81|nr:hypothetical protein [Mesorhizobium sp. B1-1-8]UCI09983.1 hypothetical protein FJ974_13475 [Mesorhizobium sp. B1-1-8]